MDTIQSTDGTKIAFTRSGRGPSLVLVNGALSDHSSAAAVLPYLEPHFTVFVYDRRGRGESGDTPPYAVDREIEDLTGLMEQVGESAALFGHSAGAILALEAVLRGLPVRRLALYEPPFMLDQQRPRPPADLPERLQALITRHDHEAALRVFFREAVSAPEEIIMQMQATPLWSKFLVLAPTTPYDARMVGVGVLPVSQLAGLHLPTLVLQGEASPVWTRNGTEALAQVLPHGSLAVLRGQAHNAEHEAPQLLADELIRFFLASERL